VTAGASPGPANDLPRIRRAEGADVPALLAISNDAAVRSAANFADGPEPLAAWQRRWRETHAFHPWLVAVSPDRREGASSIVGFARAGPHRSRAAYAWSVESTIYLDPAWCGRGLGGRLYRRLLALLRAQGYHSAVAGITLPNPASIALHESCGFRHAGTLRAIGWKFDRWHDVGYWQADLAGPDDPPGPIRSVGEVFDQVPEGEGGSETA